LALILWDSHKPTWDPLTLPPMPHFLRAVRCKLKILINFNSESRTGYHATMVLNCVELKLCFYFMKWVNLVQCFITASHVCKYSSAFSLNHKLLKYL
jgi:hypothetical protein